MKRIITWGIFFLIEFCFIASAFIGTTLNNKTLGEVGVLGMFMWLLIGCPLVLWDTKINKGNLQNENK